MKGPPLKVLSAHLMRHTYIQGSVVVCRPLSFSRSLSGPRFIFSPHVKTVKTNWVVYMGAGMMAVDASYYTYFFSHWSSSSRVKAFNAWNCNEGGYGGNYMTHECLRRWFCVLGMRHNVLEVNSQSHSVKTQLEMTAEFFISKPA